MIDLRLKGDRETNTVSCLTLEFLPCEDGNTVDLEFITKLANAMIRATIVIDPGLATEFIYEVGETVEDSERNIEE